MRAALTDTSAAAKHFATCLELLQTQRVSIETHVSALQHLGEKACDVEAAASQVGCSLSHLLGGMGSADSFCNLVDHDGDGLISFGEYMFFITLLSTSQRDLIRLFMMFDRNGSSTMDKTEFQELMGMLRTRSPTGQQVRDKTLTGKELGRLDKGAAPSRFFGVAGTRACLPPSSYFSHCEYRGRRTNSS